MKIGDKVVVLPVAFGDGLYHVGVIDGIEEFLNRPFVSIHLDKPTSNGITSLVVSNLEIIKVITDEHLIALECLSKIIPYFDV